MLADLRDELRLLDLVTGVCCESRDNSVPLSHEVAEVVVPHLQEQEILHGEDVLIDLTDGKLTLHLPDCLLYTSPSPRD